MNITFASGDLTLEGLYEAPATPTGAAVICHPHPLYGGNLHNNVVGAIDDGLRAAGFATLRFNFRGVGKSGGGYESGAGETEDVRAAAAEVLRRSGLSTCTLAGYSFGAMMVVQVGASLAGVDRIILVAPPLAMANLEPLAQCTVPKLVVAGDRDSYCGVAQLERALAGLAAPREQRILAGADHFFGGYEEEIAAAVGAFVKA